MKFPFKKIPFPCILALAVLAALTLTTPAFAEGESPPTEPVAVEPADTPPAETQPEEVHLWILRRLSRWKRKRWKPCLSKRNSRTAGGGGAVEAPVEVCAGDGSAESYFYDASHTKHGGYGTSPGGGG
jgi:hypothetical protein